MCNVVKPVSMQRCCHVITVSPLKPFLFCLCLFLSFSFPFPFLAFGCTGGLGHGAVVCRGNGSGSGTASEQHAAEAGPVPLWPHRHGRRPGGPQLSRQQVQYLLPNIIYFQLHKSVLCSGGIKTGNVGAGRFRACRLAGVNLT